MCQKPGGNLQKPSSCHWMCVCASVPWMGLGRIGRAAVMTVSRGALCTLISQLPRGSWILGCQVKRLRKWWLGAGPYG
jgi:hypothetical protein